MKLIIANVLALSGLTTLFADSNIVTAHASGEAAPVLAPVRGFYVIPRGEFINVQLSTEFTDIQRISLPRGKYIVNASAVVFVNNGPAPIEVSCIFRVDGLTVSEPASASLGATSPHEIVTLPLTVGLRLPEPNDLSLACQTGEPVPPNVEVGSQASPISAIRVHRLTVSECCESSD